MSDVTGWLYKLKDNKKEWKKVYAVLHGDDLHFFDSPADVNIGKCAAPPRACPRCGHSPACLQ